MKFKRLYNTEEHRQEVKEALNTGNFRKILVAFFFPKMARIFLFRVIIVILVAWCFFKFICLPLVIQGESMLPTYPSRGFMFCWAPAYWFKTPRIGDIVIMKYGKGAMLLKRVVALPGDKVAFQDGRLIRNGHAADEPYVKGPCDWNLPERTVQRNHYYLVGDNRSVPMELHVFGEMHKRYLQGAPAW